MEATLDPQVTERVNLNSKLLLEAEPDLNTALALFRTLGIVIHEGFESMDDVTLDTVGMLMAQYRVAMELLEKGMSALNGENTEETTP